MAMSKKLTITVDDEVYEGLHSRIGRRRISRFINDLAKPHVLQADLEAGYRAMAADAGHEREALEWIEGVVGDIEDE
jgi:predicted CopG family antitoxin